MRIDIPQQKKFVHEFQVPIQWGDMDAMGHVNNTVYFRYLESARIDWFQAIGMPPDPRGQGPVVVNAFCNFHRQLEYPGSVLVRMFVSNAGRTSFDTWATMERADAPGAVHATGGATVVWVDFPKQQSAPLPEWLRKRIE